MRVTQLVAIQTSLLKDYLRSWYWAARENLTIWLPHSVAGCTRSNPIPNASVVQDGPPWPGWQRSHQLWEPTPFSTMSGGAQPASTN